jgi:hypothetical protein
MVMKGNFYVQMRANHIYSIKMRVNAINTTRKESMILQYALFGNFRKLTRDD